MLRTSSPAIVMLGLIAGTLAAQAEDRKMITLSGHADKVHACAFLPDGKVVTAGFDRAIRIWDRQSAEVDRMLEGHAGAILTLAASPDGKHLASAGKDRVIKLWTLDSPDAPKDLAGHRLSVYHVAFSPDGKLLASCGEDDTQILIWDVEQAKIVKRLNAVDPDDKNKRRSMFRVEFSPDGKQLASCGADRTVRLWDLESGKEVRRLEGAEYAVFTEKDKKIERTVKKGGSSLALYALAFSPDGKRIAAGGLDKLIRVWDTDSGKLQQTIAGHPDFVYDARFSGDGARLLSCGCRGNLFAWNVADGSRISAAKTPAFALCAALSPDGTQVAVGCEDNNVYLLKVD
ncbi:MAG: WD40 repeat domain-containing protein [Planctomycetales bacterium]